MENLIKEQKLLIDQLKSQLEIVNTENKMLKQTHQKVSNTTQTAPQTVHNICEASQTVKDMNYMQEVDIQLEENKKHINMLVNEKNSITNANKETEGANAKFLIENMAYKIDIEQNHIQHRQELNEINSRYKYQCKCGEAQFNKYEEIEKHIAHYHS